jgi:hypothetical protein
MSGYDFDNEHRITAKVMNPDKPNALDLGNDNASAQRIALQGFETLARAHPESGYRPRERDVTYNDGETFPHPLYIPRF